MAKRENSTTPSAAEAHAKPPRKGKSVVRDPAVTAAAAWLKAHAEQQLAWASNDEVTYFGLRPGVYLAADDAAADKAAALDLLIKFAPSTYIGCREALSVVLAMLVDHELNRAHLLDTSSIIQIVRNVHETLAYADPYIVLRSELVGEFPDEAGRS